MAAVTPEASADTDLHEPVVGAGSPGVDTDATELDAQPFDAGEARSPRVVTEPARERRPPRPPLAFTPRRVIVAAVVWLLSTGIAVVLVLYGVGPLLQKRDQRQLLADYRTEIREAAGAENSFSEVEVVTTAPATGDPVAILDIPDLQLQQVVVEGVSPQQTRRGPGHVPGTAGPGQPGNSAIVARHAAFGGSFGNLGDLERGDEVLVTTTQGPSVYEITEVRTVYVSTGTGSTAPSTTVAPTTPPVDGAAAPDRTSTTVTTTTPAPPLGDDDSVSTDELYGPSEDDRLTLVSSSSRRPWATGIATVAVATIADRPFEPTPQNGRSVDQDGRGSDDSAWAPMVLAGLAYALTAVAAVLVYRRARVRSAYLLTAPPLVAATFLAAETIARLLPAWS